MSSSHLNGCTSTVTADTSSAPSLLAQCNGDVERGPNGHAHALGRGESHVEDEVTPEPEAEGSSAGRAPSQEDSGLSRKGERRTSDSGSPSPNLTFYLPMGEPVAADVEAENEGNSVTRL